MHKNPLERLLQIRTNARLSGFGLAVLSFFVLTVVDKQGIFDIWGPVWAYILFQTLFFVIDKRFLHLESLTDTFSKEDEEELLKERHLDASSLKKYWHMLYNRYLISCSVGLVVLGVFVVLMLVSPSLMNHSLFFPRMVCWSALGYLLSQGILSLVYWNTPKPYYEYDAPERDESDAQIPGTAAWCSSPLSMTGPNSFNHH